MRKIVQVIRQSHDPDKHVADSETLIYNVDIQTLSEPLKSLFTKENFPDYDIHIDWFENYREAKDYGTCDILLDMMKLLSNNSEQEDYDELELELLEKVRNELYDAYNRDENVSDEHVGLVKFSGIIYHC